MHSSSLANTVLHTQCLKHLLSYGHRFREAALKLFTWKCEEAMQNKNPGALGCFKLQYKLDAIFMSCMNDGSSRRTTSPAITPNYWGCPWRERNATSCQQQQWQNAPCSTWISLAVFHLRSDQAWTFVPSPKLGESQQPASRQRKTLLWPAQPCVPLVSFFFPHRLGW